MLIALRNTVKHVICLFDHKLCLILTGCVNSKSTELHNEFNGRMEKEIIKVSRNIMFEYTKLFMIPQLELTVIVSSSASSATASPISLRALDGKLSSI